MVSVQGNVEVRRAGQTQWQPARLNDLYCAGDRIQVGERSRADVALANQPILRVDQNSTITLGEIKEQRTALVELLRGALYFFSRRPRNLEIQTPFVNAGVEGTEGLVLVETTRTLISIFEGTVLASNQIGMLTLVSAQTAVAEQGRAPTLTVTVRPDDAVAWALYYLPTLYFRPQEFPAGSDWQGMVRKSIEAYVRGDFEAAFDSIQAIPVTLNEPRFFAYRAALLLAVGRVDEASQDIERALSLNPNDNNALSLQSIIAVVQNDKEKALALGQRAVTADPRSASARIALSYAQQSNFDLDNALNSLQQATELDPDNALAWARLAEVWLSFGRLDEALEAAKRAVALDPNLSRTQSVLGFAFLTRVNTDEAKEAFERAIVLDQTDPLPRLGLGLAKIREGDLQEGRREIEIAVSLDPQNALVRSYLGKAYFEEKRDKQAADQYEMSKGLDRRDPTPYFYDAILKQTTNRPVEALQDMEKAIELNDNRAVYRSRLLLDSDLAARSAALSRIYSDLGFQQLALVEGWKSVNTDPTNFSAHRFLADSYSVLPRHEIARVSELLQSQLLQPLNMTPIQPHLAESNLFLISAGGPTALSFNEFNPLFNRNGINFQSTGLAGENSTYAGEGVLSGIYNKAAFSLGGFHFQTDGWRTNADQKDSIGNAFLQLEVSPQTSLQGEYRYRAFKTGDIRLRFFPNDFFPGQRDSEERNTARFGLRHSFSPDSTLLGSLIHQEVLFRSDVRKLPFPFVAIKLKRPESATSTELQHLFRSQFINVTSGIGYVKVDGHTDDVTQLALPPPFRSFFTARFPTDLKHINTYAYSYLNPLNKLTITLGASGDFTNGDSPDVGHRQQFNPKFGVTWNPLSDTTIRAAAFRTLKRTLITDQTVEPTQVAGFNQFFDDNNGTSAWLYGVAVDQKFTKQFFAGSEFSHRDLNSRFVRRNTLAGTTTLGKQDEQEDLSRVYLFWTPDPWWGLRAEYMFERFKSDGLTNLPERLNTHRVPLGVSFFHPSGLSATLGPSYVHQEGRFVLLNGNIRSGSEDFWTVDAAINYRLPKRYGFIGVAATNLFDKNFRFFDRDIRNSTIQPNRTVFARMTLALP
ncbi:MAG TPA: tetratricopeptide repeat protein [Candidatus Binatia bacterium]|nr:tetratricopeptide repeat protein [Candidatus Binatia bacterium]